jgi:hypothetical protein
MMLAVRGGWYLFRSLLNDTDGKRQLVFVNGETEEMWSFYIGKRVREFEDTGPVITEAPCWLKSGEQKWAPDPPAFAEHFAAEINAFLAQQRLSGAWSIEEFRPETEGPF